MFARTVNFKIKASDIQAFRGEAEKVREALKKFPGMSHQFTVIQDDGKGLSLGVWDSEDAAKAGFEGIQKIWASLSDYLTEPLSVTSYPNVEQLAGPVREMGRSH